MDAGLIWLLRRTAAPHRLHRAPALLRDRATASDLGRYGYAVTEQRVDPRSVEALLAVYEQHRDALDEGQEERFHATTWEAGSGPHAEVRRAVEEWLVPEVAALVDPATARVMPSVLQIKPSSPDSALSAHQDSSLVDETHSHGLYAWVALTDSGVDDGPLFVLPGSHRWGRWPRAASPVDELAGLHHAIERWSRVLEVRSGQVVLFDNAVVHGSLANRSGRTRLAASCAVVPAAAELVIHRTVDGHPGALRLWEEASDTATAGPVSTWAATTETTAPGVGPAALSAVCALDRLLRPRPPGRALQRVAPAGSGAA